MIDASALLLAHGAGGGSEHPTFLALEQTLSPLPLCRMEFPYRREGRRAPDRAPKLIAAVREEAGALAEREGVDPSTIVLGGRSMGGRMCSMAIAEGLPAAGLVLLSYPLHPPKKPETLRVEHLPSITVPTLVVHGTRDPFGSPAELRPHLDAIDAPVTCCWLEDTGHDPQRVDREIAAVVAAWLAGSDVPESIPRPAPRRRREA